MLFIPAYLSKTGKKQRLFFSTEEKANEAAQRIKQQHKIYGTSMRFLTPAKMSEANEAYKRLDDFKISLLDIVNDWITRHKAATASVSLSKLFEEFFQAKAHRSPKYLQQIGHCKAKFEPLHKIKVSNLEPRQLSPILDNLRPAIRNAYMRYLQAVFNLGIKRGYLKENPISKLEFAHRPRKGVVTLPNDVVIKMLNHAKTNEPKLLGFLSLALFCGIRPDELTRMLWSDVLLDEKTVVIRENVSKTKRRRFIDISDNAVAWLNLCDRSTKKIVPFSAATLTRARRKNWDAVKSDDRLWVQQVMRHTYCSSWLAMHEDINKLVLQSGHDTVVTMWRRYHKGIRKTDAVEFWSIMP